MSVDAGFDVSELERLDADIKKLAEDTFPEETKKFVRREGEKLKRQLVKGYKTRVGRKTGNLVEGVGRGKPEQYEGSWQVRVYNNAPHAHLIEHGHVMKTHAGKPVIDELGMEKWVEGKYVAAFTTEEFKRAYAEDADKFIDSLIEGAF